MRGRYKTDIERKMAGALKAAGVEFVDEYPIRCKYGYILDFAIIREDRKLDIETDGECWHGGERDRKRDGYLKSRGWTVLRFKGRQVLDDIDSCVARIQGELSY